MTIVRRIIAAAAVAGALAVLPISGISTGNYAGGIVGGSTGGATTNGQGSWPLKS
jgi:hypothetical protein